VTPCVSRRYYILLESDYDAIAMQQYLCSTFIHRGTIYSHLSRLYLHPVSLYSFRIDNGTDSKTMPRGMKKENLPTKTCVVCGRPFNWRKKWEKVWDEVTTCSKSCNRKRKEKNRQMNSRASDVATSSEYVNIHSMESDPGDTELLLSSICDDIQALDVTNNEDATSEEDDASAHDDSSSSKSDVTTHPKLQRKVAKKRKKAERRAQREGRGDPTAGQKKCTLCSKSVNLLIRCTYDKSGEWGMVCGRCWNDVSGGVVDGDVAHPHYRYGGLWKNRRAQT
jgi:hypothetical protein